MKISDQLLDIISRTLRLETLSFSQTRLAPHHCPDDFTVRGMPGVNQYTNGSVRFEVKGRAPVLVTDGEAVFLPAHDPIRMKNLDPGRTVSVWHSFRFTILETIDLFELVEPPLKLCPDASREVGAINEQLQQLQSLKDRNFAEFVAKQHQHATRLLAIILAASTLKPHAAEFIQKTERIRPVLQYIQEHYRSGIDTERLARLLSLSTPRFFEVFREVMGVSPGKYIQAQRMQKAQELLMRTEMRVYEVAEAVGYDDVFHFSRLFKKNYRLSPDKFRKQVL